MSASIRPVFVVGAARSGTTFVQSLLASVPSFFSCAETHFFDELMAPGPVCGGYQRHRPRLELPRVVREPLLLESFAKADAGFLGIPAKLKGELLIRARTGQLTPRDYLCALMEACRPADKDKASRWVEKTPIHASYLEQIFALFPEAQIVCVQRKAKGVVRSAVSAFGVPACIAALDYFRTYRDVARFLEAEPSRGDQVFFVHYDELVHSDVVLEAMLAFLKVEDAPSATSLRAAVETEFKAMYGASLMDSIQPGMSDTPPGESMRGWRLRAIDGFAHLLDRKHSSPQASNAQRTGMPLSSMLPIMMDVLLGGGYIFAWRLRCLLHRVKAARMAGREQGAEHRATNNEKESTGMGK